MWVKCNAWLGQRGIDYLMYNMLGYHMIISPVQACLAGLVWLEPSSDILLVVPMAISMFVGAKSALPVMLALGIKVPEGHSSRRFAWI